jgi:16S rRNA (guanine1207-N2)-methyltransferase
MAGPLPPTQLLLKNAGRLTGENLLLLGVPGDDAVPEAFGRRRGALVTFEYGAYRFYDSRLPEAPMQSQFTANYAPGRVHDMAVVYLQKGAELNDLAAAMAGAAVRPGGTVFLVGENKAGIRSSADVLERRVGPIVGSDHARHCVMYEAHVDPALSAPVDLHAWEREYSVETNGHTVNVISLPGVFSHGRLDAGTRFLLDHLPPDFAGGVLDFGCGSGVIGAAIKARHPACAVTLADASAFALASAPRTFAASALSYERVAPADIFNGVEGEFDAIVTNPPFHQGIATNYDTVSSFLSECDRHLRPGGRVILVANRFLPYEGLMTRALTPPSVLAQDQKFKVLASVKR